MYTFKVNEQMDYIEIECKDYKTKKQTLYNI